VHSVLLACLAVTTPIGSAQTSKATPEFEVASIKPAAPLTPAMMRAGQFHSRSDNAAFEDSNVSLLDLVTSAYDINWNRVSGPGWMNEQFFSVAAKLPAGSTKEQIPAMLRKLLADRFKLAVHHNQKVESVYLLVVDRQGAKLKESRGDTDANTKSCSGRPGQYSCRATTIAELADNLSGMAVMFARMPTAGDDAPRNIDLPIVDQTGLKGTYDIDLQWIPPATPEGGGRAGGRNAGRFPPRDPSVKAASIFGAFERIGLKLQPGKHPFDILVIDHVERVPTEN
jgi:uncharacterized protein (TIGR03435 family)